MVSLAVAAALAGCGGDGASDMSSEAAAGRDLTQSKGCAACHGDRGQGGVGPAWIELAGSTVELADGSSVIADADYLRRSITDPQAEAVAGFSVSMPTTELSDSEIGSLVAYIQELG